MKQTLLAFLFVATAATAAQSGQANPTAQPVPPPAPDQIRTVGRIAISEHPALPAVTNQLSKDGWVGGEIPPFTPPAKPMVDVPMRDMDVSRGPDGTYYLTGTVENFWRGNPGIPLWKSRDLKNWEFVGYVWTFAKDAKADWQKGKLNADGTRTPKPMWGPRFHYIKGQWYIVYCIERLGCGILKSTSGRPEGPYADVKPDGIAKGPLYDASLFEDEDGQVYFLCAPGPRIARMKPDLSDLAEPLRGVTDAPGNNRNRNVEGPHMYKLNGRYYLILAAGVYHDNDGKRAGPGVKKTYDIWALSAPTPYGPFEKWHLAFPRAGRDTLFQDNSGRWWATWGCDDKNESVGLPFWEKPAIIPIEMDSEGKLRQAPPRD